MKTKKYIIILLSLIILTMSASLYGYTEYQGLTVKEFRFEGLKFYTPDNLKDNLQTRVGEKFSLYYIKKDFKRLYKLGAFKDIKIFIKKTSDNKLIITFKMDEYPKISDVIFEGVDELSKSDVSEIMRLKEGTHYNPAYIDNDRKEILKLYAKKGFINTRVRFDLEPSDQPNKVKLKVIINEGEKILIEQIKIIGAPHLDVALLKRAMENAESSLTGGEKIYSELNKKTDIDRILAFARWKGYIFARVLRYDVKIDWVDPEFKDKRAYYIEIEIEEGPRYNVGKIDFQGNQLFTDYELKQLMQFNKGEIYDELKFKKSLQALYDTYRTQGYIYTKVTVIEKYDRTNKIVSFVFNIFDGDRAHIETILFRGNTKTKSYVIDRELRIWEGEIFNIARINRSKERLTKIGYFKNVDMDIRPSSEEGLVDLVFTLEPQRTGMISVGGGYGTISGFSGFVEVTENNLSGRGYRISARGEIGQKLREIKLTFGSPYITRYTPISYSISMGFRWQKRQYQPYYDRNKDGVKDKLIVDGAGNLVLIQNRQEVIARANELGLTGAAYTNFVNATTATATDPYGGAPVTYDLRNYYDEQTWLDTIDYDPNGDGVYSPSGADLYTSDRHYKEYVLFGNFNIGLAFAEYFGVFSGYGLSATKLYAVSHYPGTPQYYWTTGNTAAAGTPYYGEMAYIYMDNIYDSTGDKTSFRNALISGNWLLTSKIPIGFTFDTTDSTVNPTKGFSFKFVWTFNGIGGDVRFNQMDAEIAYYIPLPFKIIWAHRISSQMIMPWFGKSKPYALEGNRLSFDGLNEARGWQDYAYYDRYVGYGKIVLSTELRLPIPGTKDMLCWVFFFDVAGVNTDKKGSKLPTNLESEYVFSWGFGLRVQIAMLPIRLYGAKRMLWKNGRLVGQGKGLEFVFSISGYF